MEEQLRALVVAGLTGLLILLRLDAGRFGSAEYDDESAPGGWRNALRRWGWYGLGVVLAIGIYELYPTPVSTLHLSTGEDRLGMILLGLMGGALGTAGATAFAWFRYQRLRLPEYRSYPGAAVNAIGTAFIDEVTFRGALLGLTLAAGWPADLAIAFQAVLYALCTRLGAPGRSHAMLGISLIVGIATGLLTVATGGIGAGLLAHAITRFAIFVTTGHAGQVQPPGTEIEEVAAERLPPEGWQVVSDDES
ncbi:MAG: type II CAAX prenyl endopeptidase Rce1 family protein [Candidatus Limnocylindrales bacterium]